MKTIKALAAGLLALTVAGTAAAQTHVRITGSTAFRKSTHAAIVNILNGAQAAWSGTASNVSGVSQAVFSGTLSSGPSAGQAVVFHVTWLGSTGGIQALAQQSPAISLTWSTTANTMSSITLSGTAASPTFNGGTNGATATESAAADVTMSDTSQAASIFSGTGYTTLLTSSGSVGVIPFVWVRGNATGAPTSFANMGNMTQLLAKNLLAGGLPLSQFSGDNADANVGVFAIGRNPDSGTRLVAFAEAGFTNSVPTQYKPVTTSGVITSYIPFPAETVLGKSYPEGQSGYSSGGSVVTELGRTVTNSSVGYIVSYLGKSDATTASSSGAAWLKYNGVDLTDANIQNGKYTFWSYEYLMYKPSLSGVAKDASDLLAQQLKTTDAASAGIVISTMNVGRTAEGEPVTFGNPF